MYRIVSFGKDYLVGGGFRDGKGEYVRFVADVAETEDETGALEYGLAREAEGYDVFIFIETI